MRGFAGYKYLALLVALLLTLVVYPLLRRPGAALLADDALVAVLFLAGAWVVGSERRLRIPGAVLGLLAVIGVWAGYAVPGLSGAAGALVFHVSAALFELLVLAALLRGVSRDETVSADAIAAALCGYLLIGLAFGHAYCLVEEALPGSFRGLAATADGDREHFVLTYFSFLTLTTVGYGDISPASAPARSLSVVEAVLGQFYLAVLIAGLIGKRLSRAPTPPPG